MGTANIRRGSGFRPCSRPWMGCYFSPFLGLERTEREQWLRV